jgi:hypothetical protein
MDGGRLSNAGAIAGDPRGGFVIYYRRCVIKRSTSELAALVLTSIIVTHA